jgi:hypothetical protein
MIPSCPATARAAALDVRRHVARTSSSAEVLGALAELPHEPEVLDALVGNPHLPPRVAAELLSVLERDHPLLPALSRHRCLSALGDDELEALDGTALLVLNPHLDDEQRALLDSDPVSAAVLGPGHQDEALTRGLFEAGLTVNLPSDPTSSSWARLRALASNPRVREDVVDELLELAPLVTSILASNEGASLRVQMPLFALRMRGEQAALEEVLSDLPPNWRRVARGFDGALGDLLERARLNPDLLH